MGKVLSFLLLGLGVYLFIAKSDRNKVEFPMTRITGAAPARTVDREERIKVLLFTGTEWCGACSNLDKSVIGTEVWKDFAAKEIRFRSLDFPVDETQVTDTMISLKKRYNVSAFPTMLVLDHENKVIGKQVGSGPPVENFKTWIRGHQRFVAAVVGTGQ